MLFRSFTDEATIRFELARSSRVRLVVYDVTGALREVLLDGQRPAGVHSLRWRAAGPAGGRLTSGVYFAVVEVAGERRVCKLVIAR